MSALNDTNRVVPARWAVLVAVVVLAGYVASLAPTVTFWDAGEFLAAAKGIGIPHPPGSPLFVLISAAWARLIPFGAFAWRVNLLSAVCSAAAAGLWFMVVYDTLQRMHGDVDAPARTTLALAGSAACALLAAFTFTAWQNANETEVYALSSLSIAATALVAVRWRAARNSVAASRLLLLAVLILGLSVGVHLMGLLAGIPLLAYLVTTARRAPMEPAAQRTEWSRIAAVGAIWVLLVGVGLGSASLVLVGAIGVAASLLWAAKAGQIRFALAALCIAAVGMSVLAFLPMRALQHPLLNEGNPSTWHALLDVIRRAQYPPRTPFDDPTVLPGPGNPHRTLTLLLYQFANYAQYFDWQWARGFGSGSLPSIPRLCVTMSMVWLGLRGAFAQRRDDNRSFTFFLWLWIATGPLLLAYLNFKPGPSIGWNIWSVLGDHEVRDRDYFFVASFVVWALWAGIGLVDVVRTRMARSPAGQRAKWTALFAAALVPFALNYRAATRNHGTEATMARDFGVALLASVPQNGILLTWGDNDTYPLWYLQQVEGLRRDVAIVCVPTTEVNWYGEQLHALHQLSDRDIESFTPYYSSVELRDSVGRYGAISIAKGTLVDPLLRLLLDIVRTNAGRRPIAWDLSASDALLGLGTALVQQGMVVVMPVDVVDSSRLVRGEASGPNGTPLDLDVTRQLIDRWDFGRLERDGPNELDGNIQAVAATIATPMRQVGLGLIARGDTTAGLRYLRRAVRVGEDSVANVALRKLGG